MRRLHLVEFSDYTWFPTLLRDFETEFLNFLFSTFGVYHAAAPLLLEALRKTRCSEVLDLCSGAAGPMVSVQRKLSAQFDFPVRVTLSDKYPNEHFVSRINGLHGKDVKYAGFPVDALNTPAGVGGFRTLFTSFHHFAENDARSVLQDAVEKGPGIAVFEITARRVSTVLRELLMPLFVLLFTPFVRPFRWSRLFCTYLIPIVPLIMVWDGIVSNLRTYSPDELLQLCPEYSSRFTWQAGRKRTIFGGVTYLIGTAAR